MGDMMRLSRHDVGIGGVVGQQAIVYVRDVRGSTWTRAYPNGPTVVEDAFADWQRDKSGWHYAPGDLDVKEMSLVYQGGGAALFVTGMGAITGQNMADHRIDDVVSLTPLSKEALHEIVMAQRGTDLRHHACPVRDQTPTYWSDTDRANARRAVEVTLSALREERRLVVHCLMGIHRSPALATVALSTILGVQLEEASRVVRSKRALATWVPETASGFAQYAALAHSPGSSQ